MKTVTVFRPCYGVIAASVLLLTGCGGGSPATQSAPTPSPEAPATSPAIPCGKVPATKGVQADVLVRAGTVDCAQATQVITQYFQKLSPSEAASPDGAGPVALGEWTCGSGAGTPVTTCSTEDSRQVEGIVAR
ncbi:hypothetical protein [Amycolatopsis sp.]|jgi:hypothetical protein|uniref:hypothetical protein n=1 Tax=Amycolatopsis sp. TaxID=37632 RepID=UPI002DFA5C07|nr:hypothetical protein [Amycolatopsis sp.]